MYTGKTSKKFSWAIGFSSLFGLWQKNLCFYRKIFGNVVKTTFYVSRGKLTEQPFSKEVLKTAGLSDNFWSFQNNGGKFFQGWQNGKRYPGEQPKEKTFYNVRGNILWKLFFKRETFAIFSDSGRFLLLVKTFARFAKPAIWLCVELLGEQQFFNYI